MKTREQHILAKAFVQADTLCEHCSGENNNGFHLTEEHEEEWWNIPENCQFLYKYMLEVREQRNVALKRVRELVNADKTSGRRNGT